MNVKEFQHKLINLEVDLIGFARQLTNHSEDAKDLVQDTFLKALKYCDKFIYESNFRAWTFTIMKNTFINNYRRSVNMNKCVDPSKEGSSREYAVVPASFHPDSMYTSKELEKTIEQLKDDLKIPFKMHHDGFRYKEIADTLDLKLGTVKSRIFLARKKLMDQVDR